MERPAENLQGSIILKPIEAQLERSLHAFIKMDPYCVAMVGNTQIKGQVCKSGGLNPLWTDAIVLQLRNDEPCFLEVKDKQMLSGDGTIGVCEIDWKSLLEQKAATKWYDLFFKRKLAGKILIDVTYTEENYGSRHIIYTKLKNVRPVEPPPPVAAKVVQKHLPGAQDNLILPQDSMRGSTGMKMGSSPAKSPGSGNKETSINQQIGETQNVEVLNNQEAVPVIGQEAQNNISTTSITKKKKGFKLFKSIKNMFDTKGTKKNQQQQQPLPATTLTADDYAPLTRTKPVPPTNYASTGGVPAAPVEGILERKKPSEPKPSLLDFLQNENRNQMTLNRPVEPIIRDGGFVRTMNPSTQPEYVNDKFIDQYRSVGHSDLGVIRKVPELRLSEGNGMAQDYGYGNKMTPDWKQNTIAGNGESIRQTQEARPASGSKRISDLLQNREVFNYR